MDGRDIRALREEGLNWDLRKFAEEVGVSPATVRSWEQGRSKPSPLARKKMKKVFDENLKHLEETGGGDIDGADSELPESSKQLEISLKTEIPSV